VQIVRTIVAMAGAGCGGDERDGGGRAAEEIETLFAADPG
jgi:hypothetical protein